jgi:hypothetical protein
MEKEAWPKYKNGQSLQKKADNGQLPIYHPAISSKTDKGHAVREYSKKYFALASLPKSENFGVSKLDAKWMKQHNSWLDAQD